MKVNGDCVGSDVSDSEYEPIEFDPPGPYAVYDPFTSTDADVVGDESMYQCFIMELHQSDCSCAVSVPEPEADNVRLLDDLPSTMGGPSERDHSQPCEFISTAFPC